MDKETLKARLLTNRLIDSITGCWLWLGAKDRHGYGVIKVAGQQMRVPRLASHLWNRVPLGHPTVVRHTCDTPSCFNPAHLLRGSQRDNMRDAAARNRLKVPSRLGLRKDTATRPPAPAELPANTANS